MTQAVLGFVLSMIRVICYIVFPSQLVVEERLNIAKKILIKKSRISQGMMAELEARAFKESFYLFLQEKDKISPDPVLFEIMRKVESLPPEDLMQLVESIYSRAIDELEKQSQAHTERMAELRKGRILPVFP